MYKVIVAGTRTFSDYTLLKEKLLSLLSNRNLNDVEIVSGTAQGADKLGERFAEEFGCALKRFPADWDLYGKKAGPIRNEQMANYADACVVFWDGVSRGTMNMTTNARQKGLELRVIKY